MPTKWTMVLVSGRGLGVAAAAGWSLCGALAVAQPVLRGERITTESGRTLYTFDNDIPGSGVSVCSAPCSNIFPPYRVTGAAKATGDYGIVVRSDGARQWAYKGRPLYLFYGDAKPGDQIGDGMNRNIWHVARP